MHDQQQNLRGLVSVDAVARRMGCTLRLVHTLLPHLPRHTWVDGQPYWTAGKAKQCVEHFKDWKKLPLDARRAYLELPRGEQERVRTLAREGWAADAVGRMLDVSESVAEGALRAVQVVERWQSEIDPTAYVCGNAKERYVTGRSGRRCWG